MNNVWLVTGSASGLDRNIAQAVLESGDRLVATDNGRILRRASTLVPGENINEADEAVG